LPSDFFLVERGDYLLTLFPLGGIVIWREGMIVEAHSATIE